MLFLSFPLSRVSSLTFSKVVSRGLRRTPRRYNQQKSVPHLFSKRAESRSPTVSPSSMSRAKNCRSRFGTRWMVSARTTCMKPIPTLLPLRIESQEFRFLIHTVYHRTNFRASAPLDQGHRLRHRRANQFGPSVVSRSERKWCLHFCP